MTRRTGVRLLIALACAVAAPAAQAQPLLPGCYGAGSVIVCDVSVGAETYQTSVEVCAGSCRDVEVTLVRTTDGGCISYVDRGGETHHTCALYRYSYSSDPYSGYPHYSGACSQQDAPGGVEQSLCVDTYNDGYGNQSTCINLTGIVEEQLYCV